MGYLYIYHINLKQSLNKGTSFALYLENRSCSIFLLCEVMQLQDNQMIA